MLPVYGPWLLFVLAILETSFITGLAVPSGLATSVGTILALEGTLTLPPVVAAALAGGAIGDTAGFWIGRAVGTRVLGGEGRTARLLAGRHAEMSRFFGRHPLYSVTLARLVSFVRTVMPMAAGMSGISYHRYLAFEAVGLVGWASLYVLIGVLAGESWRLATRIVGVGGTVAFCVAGLALWWVLRRRTARSARSPAPEA
jgi:undecaprenyl-diphosphatase